MYIHIHTYNYIVSLSLSTYIYIYRHMLYTHIGRGCVRRGARHVAAAAGVYNDHDNDNSN